jgi:hypothetical protein
MNFAPLDTRLGRIFFRAPVMRVLGFMGKWAILRTGVALGLFWARLLSYQNHFRRQAD